MRWLLFKISRWGTRDACETISKNIKYNIKSKIVVLMKKKMEEDKKDCNLLFGNKREIVMDT